MGTSLLPQSINNMKFLLVVTLVAYTIAEAEPKADADPALLYGAPLIYGAVGAVPHLPTVSVKTVTPAEVKTVVNTVTYAYGLGYPGLGYAGLGGHLGYPYGLVPAVAAAAAEEEPAVEAADRKKREAEAEADPKADPWLAYSGLGYSGLGYAGLGYAGHGGYLGYPYFGLVPTAAAAAE